jgi:hypothetical protein
VALVTRAEKDGKGVTRDSVAADRALALIVRPGQMAVDTNHLGFLMNLMGLILNLLLVARGAQGIRGRRFTGALGVDFVAINAGDIHLAVAA